MRGGFRAAALLAALLLFGAACTLTGTSQTAQTSPSAQASPSEQATPSSSSTPTSTPGGGNTESPPATPESSPSTAPRLFINSLSYHVGEVGVGYAPVTAGASGGTPPYKWSVGSGALPAGLTMSSGGSLSGTPTAPGTATFVVLLQDSAGQAAGVSRSINVAPHVAAAGTCAKACNVEEGCITVCGTYTALSGGVAPFSFAMLNGALPPGMTLNGPALAGPFPLQPGVFTAAPPPFTFMVGITDALGATASVNAVFDVFPHLSFTTTNAVCGNSPSSCNLSSIFFTGGVPGSTDAVVVGTVSGAVISFMFMNPNGGLTCGQSVATSSPPPGMTTSAAAGTMNLAAGPPPSSKVGDWCNYSGTITFTLVDSDPCGPGVSCASNNTLTVTFGL